MALFHKQPCANRITRPSEKTGSLCWNDKINQWERPEPRAP